MLPESQGVTLLGVRLNDAVLDAALTLTPGVTALYGKNGAGKTSVLDALASLLRGESTAHYWLFARVDPSATVGGDAADAHPVIAALAASVVFGPGLIEIHDLMAVYDAPGETVDEAMRRGLDASLRNAHFAEGFEEHIDEVSRQHLLAIRCDGPGGSWSVHPAATC